MTCSAAGSGRRRAEPPSAPAHPPDRGTGRPDGWPPGPRRNGRRRPPREPVRRAPGRSTRRTAPVDQASGGGGGGAEAGKVDGDGGDAVQHGVEVPVTSPPAVESQHPRRSRTRDGSEEAPARERLQHRDSAAEIGVEVRAEADGQRRSVAGDDIGGRNTVVPSQQVTGGGRQKRLLTRRAHKTAHYVPAWDVSPANGSDQEGRQVVPLPVGGVQPRPGLLPTCGRNRMVALLCTGRPRGAGAVRNGLSPAAGPKESEAGRPMATWDRSAPSDTVSRWVREDRRRGGRRSCRPAPSHAGSPATRADGGSTKRSHPFRIVTAVDADEPARGTDRRPARRRGDHGGAPLHPGRRRGGQDQGAGPAHRLPGGDRLRRPQPRPGPHLHPQGRRRAHRAPAGPRRPGPGGDGNLPRAWPTPSSASTGGTGASPPRPCSTARPGSSAASPPAAPRWPMPRSPFSPPRSSGPRPG